MAAIRPAGSISSGIPAPLLGLSAFLLVGALSFQQLSSPAVAQQLIAEGVAALTEVDLVLTEFKDDIDEEAAGVADGELLTLPGYPLEVRFTRDEVLRLSEEEFRDLLLARSADIVYDEGLGAFGQDGGSISLFSSEGVLDMLVGMLSETNHTRSGWAAAFLGLLSVIAGVMVVVRSTGFTRIRALGVPLAMGGLAGLITFGGIVALILGRWWGGDPFSDQVDVIIGDAIGIARRNYIILTLLGLSLVLVGILFELIARFGLRRTDEIAIGDDGL
jgi:hypothetical protein